MSHFHPEKYNRRSIRLKGFDYAQPGGYFVTIGLHHRMPCLGRVERGKMVLSRSGRMVHEVWCNLPKIYPNIEIDAFIAMPDHIHGIVVLLPDEGVDRARLIGGTRSGGFIVRPWFSKNENGAIGDGQRDKRVSLPDVVKGFKSYTTREYSAGVRGLGWKPYDRRFWHRNYYEHIIRDDVDLTNIRRYIRNNPMKWWLKRRR